MNSFWQDVSYALRVLMKHRGFAAIAILTLALGIGANTALFSVVNGVLLNPLPYPNPRQLVALAERFPPFSEASIAYPNFLDWVRMNHTFEGLAAYRHTYFNLTGSGEAQRLNAVQVSATFFSLLGTEPVIGRNFSPDDDKQVAQPVAMLSGRFWKTKFGGSPEILGKMLTLDGTGYTVIGVVPENFYFCCESMNFDLGDIYVPIGSANEAWLTQRDSHPGIRGLGRMKPRVTIEQARADMNNIALNLSKAYPDTPKDAQVTLTPLRERMVEGIQTTLVVLLAAAGFVLLIACANVANLLLSRGTGRTREFAIRSALGATQNRIVRQLLTESVLLGVAGGSLGLALAVRGTKAALAVLPQTLPRANEVRLDPHVLGFTLIVSILAGVLFGLAPALKTARPDLQEALKEGGRGISGARHRAQRVFVVAELTLAVVLSIGAGLTVRSLTQLWTANWGFKSESALSFDLAFPPSIGKETPAQVRAMLEQLPQKLAQIPGVEAASVTDASVPFSDDWEETFWIESRGKPPTQSELPETLLYIVSPDYLRVMGIPLVRGRFFTSQDSPLSGRVAVIDETFAREYFRNHNPIGQQIVLGNSPMVVVGIVGHTEQWGVDDKDRGSVRVQLYALADQMPDVWLNGAKKGAGLVIRMQSPNYPNAEVIRSAMQQINSEQVTYNFRPMDQIISKSLASRRFAMILLSVFAVMALLLASIGIYGVLSYFTSQRTNEIGVRMALGAQSRDVLVLVLSDAGRMIFVGVLMGLIAGAFLATVVKNMLFGVSATDPFTFVVVALLLSAVAFAACYIPARRAANVDPITALRYE